MGLSSWFLNTTKKKKKKKIVSKSPVALLIQWVVLALSNAFLKTPETCSEDFSARLGPYPNSDYLI